MRCGGTSKAGSRDLYACRSYGQSAWAKLNAHIHWGDCNGVAVALYGPVNPEATPSGDRNGFPENDIVNLLYELVEMWSGRAE
jgi:hypothetical protein